MTEPPDAPSAAADDAEQADPQRDPFSPPPADGGGGAKWRRRQPGDPAQGKTAPADDNGSPGPIGVLRIGHRPGRDKRITTHICLTARAFGADVAYVHEDDPRVVATVRDVVGRFGGPFEVHGVDSWRQVLTRWKEQDAQVVHLTMYGEAFEAGLARLEPHRATLFVAGAEKVPPDVYERADVNLSVGNQPHSEVAATAVVLDRFLTGDWAHKPFEGRVQVVPRERGKDVSSRGTQ